MNRKLLPLLAHLTLCFIMNAQQDIISSGKDFSNGVGSVSFSIGQINYLNNIGNSNISTSDGVQQPLEFFSLDLNKSELSPKILLYPNPSENNLYIQIKDYETNTLEYSLYNIQGQILFNGTIKNQITDIGISELQSGTYILKVYNENSKVESFKIIKRN